MPTLTDNKDQVRELTLMLESGEVVIRVDGAEPDFEAWLQQHDVDTALFLPAHNPGRWTWRSWSKRRANKLRGIVDDARAAPGVQRLGGKLRPVPGVFVPGLARSRAREIMRRLNVNTFFWMRAGQGFEAHMTKAFGIEDAFGPNALRHAQDGRRDLGDALLKIWRDPTIVRSFTLGSFWALLAFLCVTAGTSYALSLIADAWAQWALVALPTIAIGLRSRRLHSDERLPTKELNAAEVAGRWEAVAPQRAAAWVVASLAMVVGASTQLIERGGDQASVFAGSLVDDIVWSVWMIQAVSFSGSVWDIPKRIFESAFNATLTVFAMRLLLWCATFTTRLSWSWLASSGIFTATDSVRYAIDEVILLTTSVSLLVLALGFAWTTERALFARAISE